MKSFFVRFILIIITFLFFIDIIRTQPLPKNSFQIRIQKFKHDSGISWDSLSSIFSPRNDLKNYESSFSLKNKSIKIASLPNQEGLFSGANLHFKNYYIFFELNIKDKLSTITFPYSGFGYQNKWVMMQIGNSSESWGAGSDIELALGEGSKPYDYFMLSSNYGHIRVNYIHGLLEINPNQIFRYINARGVEWSNKRSLIVSLTETIVYSGTNRSMEFPYLNPIASHLEIELNNRLTTHAKNNANAVWQLHVDYLYNKKNRFSINMLFDEFVIDPDIEIGKEHGRAISLKYVRSIKLKNKHFWNLSLSHVKIGTPTFRHGNGENNFVKGTSPIGWSFGSDGKTTGLGVSYLFKRNLVFDFVFSKNSYGSESIISNPYQPYKDYQSGKFPSGIVTNSIFLKGQIHWMIKPLISIVCSNDLLILKKESYLKIGLGMSLDFN